MTFPTRLAGVLLAAGILLLAAWSAGEAQQRMVIVNGSLMTPQQLYLLDNLNGGYVPDGNYWLDTNTGIWGYAGDPRPRGRLGGGGGGSGTYSGQLDRGPFGTYMSDGNCSFVNGVPVGNC